MATIITVLEGQFQNGGRYTDMTGIQFELVRHFRTGAHGGYINVDGGTAYPKNPALPARPIRIRCKSANSYEVVSSDDTVCDTGASRVLIEIKDGVYRLGNQGVRLNGLRFEMIGDLQDGFITVDGGSVQPPHNSFPKRPIKIRCESDSNYFIVDDTTPPLDITTEDIELETMEELASYETLSQARETDDQIIERLRGRFEVLKDMTYAVKCGNVRAMIVTGPPGVGKSFGVDEVLAKDDLFDSLAERKPKYEIVKGAMSAIGLYSKLYEYSEKGNVIVFDDCDSILLDELSLNILKAALDSSKRRWISWNTDSRVLRNEGIPDRFEFKAGVIFITNIQFANVRSKKLQDHLAALESRCHFIDLQMDTQREKILRIKQIVKDGMLDDYHMTDAQKDEVVQYVSDNANKLRELSLRTVLKVADLRKSFENSWQNVASVTIMRH